MTTNIIRISRLAKHCFSRSRMAQWFHINHKTLNRNRNKTSCPCWSCSFPFRANISLRNFYFFYLFLKIYHFSFVIFLFWEDKLFLPCSKELNEWVGSSHPKTRLSISYIDIFPQLVRLNSLLGLECWRPDRTLSQHNWLGMIPLLKRDRWKFWWLQSLKNNNPIPER